jgi:hypothetical protein
MKTRVVVLGSLLCLGVFAQGQTSDPNKSTQQQSANRLKRTDTAAQSVTGCVDEMDGHYVLRDIKTDQLIRLTAMGTSADNDFARFVGHQAQASGTMSSGTMTVTSIGQVADMCPVGK